MIRILKLSLLVWKLRKAWMKFTKPDTDETG